MHKINLHKVIQHYFQQMAPRQIDSHRDSDTRASLIHRYDTKYLSHKENIYNLKCMNLI